MATIEEAQYILKALGLPEKQYNKRSALTLLALCGLKAEDSWTQISPVSVAVMGNKDNPKYPGIMRFIAEHHGEKYAENSRETFRRQTLHQFVQAGIVEYNPESPKIATNSKDNHYRLSPAATEVISSYGTENWEKKLQNFKATIGTLTEQYLKVRIVERIEVTVADGFVLTLSAGDHNVLQKAIIEDFGAIFAKGSKLLYVGDTAKKDLYVDRDALSKMGVDMGHDKLPDVVLYDAQKNWVYLIEAVTSHGPVSPKRLQELEKLFKESGAGLVYVSAFLRLTDFKKYASDIAWETEVWVAERPEHMIHFNGDRFVGPR